MKSRTGRLLSAKLVAAMGQFAVGLVIARVLGPAAKGQVAYAVGTGTLIAIAANGSLFVGASNLGILGGTYAVRWSDRLILGMAACLVVAGIVAAELGNSMGPLNGELVFLMLVGSAVVSVNTFRTRSLQALGDSTGFVRVTFAQSLIYVVAAGACLLIVPGSVLFLVGAWILAAGLASLASHRLTVRRLAVIERANPGGMGERSSAWKQDVLRASFAAHAANIGQHVAYRGDLVVLGLMVRPGPVGQYAVATSLMEGIWLVAEALALRIYDRSGEAESSMSPYDRALWLARWGDGVSAAMAFAVVVITWILQPVVLPAYDKVPTLTLILAPGIVLGTRLRINIAQLAVADSRGSSVLMGLAGAGSLAIYVAFIGQWGVVGAAAASSANYLALSLGSQALLRRARAKWAI